jgi:hypothetical protein
MVPPPGATVLFDGSSLEAWDNAEKDDRGFFAPLDPVTMTRKRFSDFSLHLEFRLPFLPLKQGQSRANSGLKFLIEKALYAEIQILDSFGNEPRTDECGGIEVLFPPDVVAGFPPLAWQTYDIHLTTADPADTSGSPKGRMTVWHNGILIHRDRVVTMGQAVNIALRKYGDPIYFRNIWILEGNDRYPFLPGASIRPEKREAALPFRSRVRVASYPDASGPSVWISGPEGAYRPNGSRIPAIPSRNNPK